MRENGDILPNFEEWDIQKHWTAQIPLNVFLYSMICEEALVKAGCEMLFHAMPTKVEDDRQEKILSVAQKEGLSDIRARVIVDCTGDANVARFAGCKTERSDKPQPATYICRLLGYDLTAINIPALAQAYDLEVDKGNLRYTDISWNTLAFEPMLLVKHGDNANHIPHVKESYETSKDRSVLAREGSLALLRLYRFLKIQQGFENLHIDYLAPECGVRESVRIVGQTKIETEDFLSGKVFVDAVCYAFYPVDLHNLNGDGLKNLYMKEGIVPTVPCGALLPQNIKNIIVAGRCVASDQIANSAIRVEASCMAIGQAAGAIAALSVIKNTDAENVAMEDVRTILRQHDANMGIAIDLDLRYNRFTDFI